MLTRHQKQEFFQNGFLKIPRVIPQLMVDVALRAINHSVGNTERQDSEPSIIESLNSATSYGMRPALLICLIAPLLFH